MNGDYRKTIDNIVNTEMIRDLPSDRIWVLSGELDDILENYDRELAIIYIGSNYSESKHLCQTILRGKHDEDIRNTLSSVKETIKDEMNRRKK